MVKKTNTVAQLFDDEPGAIQTPRRKAWQVMLVDDDDMVHNLTKMVLNQFTFLEQKIEIISAYSAKEARDILKNDNRDIAVLIVDVVMETDVAGLELVEYVRNELQNDLVRIILRTGQPGQAPERDVVLRYDINDYKEKSDLSSQKLNTTIITALRTYSQLRTIQDLKLTNEIIRNTLEKEIAKFRDQNDRLKERIELEMNKNSSGFCGEIENIINQVRALVCIKDLQGRYLATNESYRKMMEIEENPLGRTDEELFGDTEKSILSVDPSSWVGIEDKKIILVDGEKHIKLAKAPLFDTHGSPYALLGVLAIVEN